jgi:hypothetical protein
MGAAGRAFLHFRMEEEHYMQLEEELRHRIEPLKVVVENVDYSYDELWNSLKKESIKSYKKLKDREYDLRHNKNLAVNKEEE